MKLDANFAIMIEQNKSNIKQTWSILKKGIGKDNDTSSIAHTININNVIVTDKTEITEPFNKRGNQPKYTEI